MIQIHPKTKNVTVLYTPTHPARLSYPLAITEDEIALIEQDTDGKRKLSLWNKKTQQIKSLPLDQEDILSLSKIKGGLLYNSAVSGVPNLYFWNEETQSLILSHTPKQLFEMALLIIFIKNYGFHNFTLMDTG